MLADLFFRQSGLNSNNVAANHENDTSLWSGLVMGKADCLIYAGLDTILLKSFTSQFGPLPDTLQASTCIFQFLPSGQYGLCFGYFVSGPLLQRSHTPCCVKMSQKSWPGLYMVKNGFCTLAITHTI